MTSVVCKNISKRFGYQWIVRDLNFEFSGPEVYGLSGSNGSGKSTLIKLLSGYLTPSQGKINYQVNDKEVSVQHIFRHISLAAPYTDLINEYTLREMFDFHKKFKKMNGDINFKSFEELINLPGQSQKTLQHFSSGMKQKIQLALAVLSDSPILLLDEPTSFLDINAKKWFADLISNHIQNRLVIIASNDGFDLELCREVLSLDK